MKKNITIIFVMIFMVFAVGCSSYYVPETTSKRETTKATIETTTAKKEYTEEEYKALCKEMYNDDFFKSKPNVGQFAKVSCMISQKYKYTSSSMQGILVEDITDEYELELKSIGCTVMHEETKNDAVPSYFGEYIYMMFDDNMEFYFDYLKTGNKVIVYGEIIQNKNGIYILPKYIEEE